MLTAAVRKVIDGLVERDLEGVPFLGFVDQIDRVLGCSNLCEGGHLLVSDKLGVLVVTPRIFDNFVFLYVVDWLREEVRLLGAEKIESQPFLVDDVEILKAQRLESRVEVEVKLRLRGCDNEPIKLLAL